ncbi:16S rRNA m(2)G-966 methyltransferase [Sulfurivirga caldicuralii]|uniref:Ribosomal RNA small subunit methyltransferase D n=1 Tax=Sulfurivirga caldicuralii TaxID=364032 RepID=A0A1N6GX11_9GAMM|nr:16S rRNA (guanine(966)-N(2))-methyltransferase RsmD [Sulfurivirga caldicuralii]SIO12083.1 16S rRNA m(2)G-966 methyltransferase [Sulfurivirga caldicuralii]
MAGHKGKGRIRIVGGEWARRQLPVIDAPGLRPTSDRMRETLFNWLQFDLPGARVLDAFAGTGALGLEALSRGAEAAVFLERSGKVARQLAANLNTLGAAARGQVVNTDALRWLRQPAAHVFDIVFIDPPFDAALQQVALDALEENGWLAPGARVYVEQPRGQALPQVPPDWALHRDKIAGEVRYLLYHLPTTDTDA